LAKRHHKKEGEKNLPLPETTPRERERGKENAKGFKNDKHPTQKREQRENRVLQKGGHSVCEN